jgi:hypothetical protein
MIKSPYSNSIVEKLKHDTAVIKLAQDLIAVHEKFIAKMEEIDNLINKKIGPKGEKGEKGDRGESGKDGKNGENGSDGYVPTREELLSLITPLIPEVQSQKLIITDEHIAKITEKVSKGITLPTPIIKNELDIENLLSLLDKAPKGKRLNMKFIDGLEQTIQSLSSQITSKGYIRGGGDIVKAGTGITVVVDSNGNKIISSSITGANFATESLTGTQSGNNVTLNLASLSHSFISISFVTRQGQILNTSLTDGWSRVGNIITITNADANDTFQVSYNY